jgi:hypothetical protein
VKAKGIRFSKDRIKLAMQVSEELKGEYSFSNSNDKIPGN